MTKSDRPHVVIINKNYPPRAGVTGESACEMAEFLIANGCDVSIVTALSSYSGGGGSKQPAGKVYHCWSLYDGKRKSIRLLSSFFESANLLWRARRLRGTVYIVMTDPAFLGLLSTFLIPARKKMLWSMDLYPEAFAAGKLVKQGGLLYRIYDYLNYRRAPGFLVALGRCQADYLLQKFRKAIRYCTLPCGIFRAKPTDVPQWRQNAGDKVLFGYCGNLGEAHSASFVRSLINHLKPNEHHFVLSCYGAKAAPLLELARGREGVDIVSSISRDELSLIDVHLVSLLSDWKNTCVPSKAVSAICAGGTMFFCGPQDCDTWRMFQEAGWRVDDADDSSIDQAVCAMLQQITKQDLVNKKAQATMLGEGMQAQAEAAYHEILDHVREMHRP